MNTESGLARGAKKTRINKLVAPQIKSFTRKVLNTMDGARGKQLRAELFLLREAMGAVVSRRLLLSHKMAG